MKTEGCFLGFFCTSPPCHSACSCWGTLIHPGTGSLVCPRWVTFIFLTSSHPAKCQPVTSASHCWRSQWKPLLPSRALFICLLSYGDQPGGNEFVTKVTFCGCVLGNLGLGLTHATMSALLHPLPCFLKQYLLLLFFFFSF